MPDGYSAIIAAGGANKRFGSLEKLKDKLGGKSVITHSLDAFDADPACGEVLLSVSREVREWIAGDPLTFASPKMKLLDGGPSRAESIALAARAAKSPVLVLQDASRPNFGEELLRRVLATVKPDCGAAPVRVLHDAVAQGAALDKSRGQEESFLGPKADFRIGLLASHVPPSALYEVQTPQAYYRETYLKALTKAGAQLASYEDDSALYLAAGFQVALVSGRIGNIRIVTQDDLNFLHKLMGTTQKKKDKYGGLGW